MADRKISEFTEVLSLGDGEFLPAVNPALGSSANANRIIARGNLGFEEAGAAASAVSTHESTYDHANIATAIQPADLSALKLDDLAAPDDNTDLNATTSAHGLAPKAVAPAAGSLAALGIANGETAYSSKVILEGALKLAVVAALPGTPDSTTLYFVTG